MMDSDCNLMHQILIESKSDSDIVNSMKIFARFNTPEDHINLLNSMILESSIRTAINDIKQVRNPENQLSTAEITSKISNKKIKFLFDKHVYSDALNEKSDGFSIDQVQKINQRLQNQSEL